MIPTHCISSTTDSVIKFQELRSVARFHNPGRKIYTRVVVDGCAISSGAKCDYLLYREDGTAEYYIELKGSDVPHAIDQLRATIMKLGGTPTQRMAIVACTKVAPHITTQIQKAKKEFRSRFNSLLLIKEYPVDINLD